MRPWQEQVYDTNTERGRCATEEDRGASGRQCQDEGEQNKAKAMELDIPVDTPSPHPCICIDTPHSDSHTNRSHECGTAR